MQDKWNVKKQERLSKDTCCSGYQNKTNSCTGGYRREGA